MQMFQGPRERRSLDDVTVGRIVNSWLQFRGSYGQKRSLMGYIHGERITDHIKEKIGSTQPQHTRAAS
jgi:hypothetical protein